MQDLKVGVSTTITLNPFEEGNYRIVLDHKMQFKSLLFKFVSLVGDCIVYLSTTTKYPDEHNNESELRIKNQNFTSIATKTFHKLLKSATLNRLPYIYMSIFADSYSVIDVYSDYVFQDIDNVNQWAERLKVGQIAYRSLTEDSSLRIASSEVFYKDFVFFLQETQIRDPSFDIQINSELMGLKICVQAGNYFDARKPCDFESSTENLKIKNKPGLFVTSQPFFIRI